MELEAGIVFRLANITSAFPSNSAKLKIDHLILSDNDRAVAARKGVPPRLSVFDSARSTVAQAKFIRGGAAETAAYGLRVEAIRAIRVHPLPPLRVVRELLDPPERYLPGADGHCGIEGLDRPPGLENSKLLMKEVRAELVRLSFLFTDGAIPP